MARPYRLSPGALVDLEEIWRYGAEKWSANKADAYSEKLFAVFEFLSANPKAAKLRNEFRPFCRIHPCAEHLIVYREIDEHIEIARIRHRSEDWLSDPVGANDK